MKTTVKINPVKAFFLFLTICLLSFNGFSQNEGITRLILKNAESGKEKVIGFKEKITIWKGEDSFSGKYTLVGDSHIVINNEKHALADITEIRANSKNPRIGGVALLVLGAIPVLGGTVAVIADGGNTLLTPIALGVMTLGAPPIIAGSCLAFIKKKRTLGEEWSLVIK